MRWFVSEENLVDRHVCQFGPLATAAAARAVRDAIEQATGDYDLWVVRDDDHALSYDRSLTVKYAPVTVREAGSDRVVAS